MTETNDSVVLQENRNAEAPNQQGSSKPDSNKHDRKPSDGKTQSTERRDAAESKRSTEGKREDVKDKGATAQQEQAFSQQQQPHPGFNMPPRGSYHMPPTYGHGAYHHHPQAQAGQAPYPHGFHPSMHHYGAAAAAYAYHGHHAAYAASYSQQQPMNAATSHNNKKRTIDGISDLSHQPLPSHAYSFRRTDSSCSSTTAATNNNLNNSLSTDNSRDDLSPVNEESELPALNVDGMGIEDRHIYPSASHDASIASSFTIGDISMTSSFENQAGKKHGVRGGSFCAHPGPMSHPAS